MEVKGCYIWAAVSRTASGWQQIGTENWASCCHQNFPRAALAQALFAERVCLANWFIESNSYHNKGLHPTHFAILFLPEPGSSGWATIALTFVFQVIELSTSISRDVNNVSAE